VSPPNDPRDLPERAREEFFSEAQEIVDILARDLLALDEALRRNAVEPDTVNDFFRGVHTLKGLAGLFGLDRLSRLTHELENKLDELRLGKLALSPDVLDRLFRAVELIGRLLAAARLNGRDDDPELEAFLKELQKKDEPPSAKSATLGDYAIDPSLVSVLTEYEEHRLRTNIQAGTPLYRIRARFPLLTIDKGLDDLKARARPLGEIITYLPTGSSGDADSLELDILLASSTPLEQVRQRIEAPGVTVSEIPRTGGSASPVPSRPVPGNAGQAEHQASVAAVAPRPGPADESLGAIPAPPRMPDDPASIAAMPPARSAALAGAGALAPEPPRRAHAAASDDVAPVPAASGERHTPVPPRRHMPVAPRPEGSSGGGGDGEGGGRGLAQRASHTVRVDIRRLDHLMNVLGELAIVRGALSRLTDRVRQIPGMREVTTELHGLHRAFDRNLAEMQSGILEVRMVPLGQVFERLARAVRQISRANDKEIRLVITGAETEVDKLIVEELSDPLLHIVRNSIDHGIELAADRARLGKPVEGTIALNAYQAGNHVMIEIEDDGAGIDERRVLGAAVRRGVLREDEARELSRREILNLIFLPGFSTRENVTDLSGRGVGLDVVKTNISRLGGVVDVSSEAGIGTKFTITLPITLAILRALLLGVAGRTYALPLSSVAEATVLETTKVRTIEGREVISLRGETLPLCRLDRLFGLRHAPHGGRQFVVVVALGGRRVGLVVDELFGQQDIVIKALGPSLAGVRGFAGATDLGDQRVGLVLDAAALLEEILAGASERRMAEVQGGRIA
jgi:two-component system chemotaxis sensor kinase CheA